MAGEINACSGVLDVNIFKNYIYIYFVFMGMSGPCGPIYHSAPVEIKGRFTGVGPGVQTHYSA